MMPEASEVREKALRDAIDACRAVRESFESRRNADDGPLNSFCERVVVSFCIEEIEKLIYQPEK